MKRLKRLEKNGWHVIFYMSGRGCEARKGNRIIRGSSITNLHKKIFGY